MLGQTAWWFLQLPTDFKPLNNVYNRGTFLKSEAGKDTGGFQAQARGGDDWELEINTSKGSAASACIPEAGFCCCVNELRV
jgi:hypothetical protein